MNLSLTHNNDVVIVHEGLLSNTVFDWLQALETLLHNKRNVVGVLTRDHGHFLAYLWKDMSLEKPIGRRCVAK